MNTLTLEQSHPETTAELLATAGEVTVEIVTDETEPVLVTATSTSNPAPETLRQPDTIPEVRSNIDPIAPPTQPATPTEPTPDLITFLDAEPFLDLPLADLHPLPSKPPKPTPTPALPTVPLNPAHHIELNLRGAP